MRVTVEMEIAAPRADVWRLVTDIENAPATIKAIERVEVLERPRTGIVGLKWRETRTMFGKTATEVMWVTNAVEGSHYETRAESHGSVYKTRIDLHDRHGRTCLAMTFEGEPQSVGAKIMWGLTGFLFKGATRKALAKDLEDIRDALERKAGA
jgi:uncharacterized membrane protein